MTKLISRKGTTIQGKEWEFVTGGGEDAANRLEEIFSSSDRVAVIVGNAYLDELLTELLTVFLVNDKDTQSRFFDPKSGVISTFAAKVDMAFLLGLISKDVKDSLKGMAILRNLFAHKSMFSSFDSISSTKSNQKEVKASVMKFQKKVEKFAGRPTETDNPADLRRLYLALLPTLGSEIRAATRFARGKALTERKGTHSQIVIRI